MKPRGPDWRKREHIEWEDNFFDEIRIRHDERGRHAEGLGNDVVEDEPQKQSECEVNGSLIWQDAELVWKNDPKHEHIEPEHKQRIEHRPEQAEVAAAMTQFDRAHR